MHSYKLETGDVRYKCTTWVNKEGDGTTMSASVVCYDTTEPKPLVYERNLSRGPYNDIKGTVVTHVETYGEIGRTGQERKEIKIGRIGTLENTHLQPEDFGPQRFCIHCGIRLEEKWIPENQEMVWKHPIDLNASAADDCSLAGEYMDEEAMSYGTPKHSDRTLKGLRWVYSTLKGKDKAWMKDNMETLKSLYEEHDDFAGKLESENIWPTTMDPETGEVREVEYSDKVLDALWVSPIDVEGDAHRLTNFERHTTEYVSDVILINHMRCEKALHEAFKNKKIGYALYSHLLELVIHCRVKKIFHPKVERWYRMKTEFGLRKGHGTTIKPITEVKWWGVVLETLRKHKVIR